MAFKAIVQATQDTWSRKTRRRKRQMQDPLNENMGGENASTEVSETSENLRGLAEELTSPKPFHSSSMSSPVPELTLASAPILIVGIGAYILHLSDPVPTIEEGSLLHPGLPGLSTHNGLGELQDRRLPQFAPHACVDADMYVETGKRPEKHFKHSGRRGRASTN